MGCQELPGQDRRKREKSMPRVGFEPRVPPRKVLKTGHREQLLFVCCFENEWGRLNAARRRERRAGRRCHAVTSPLSLI
jgi:hypothetical protein